MKSWGIRVERNWGFPPTLEMLRLQGVLRRDWIRPEALGKHSPGELHDSVNLGIQGIHLIIQSKQSFTLDLGRSLLVRMFQ